MMTKLDFLNQVSFTFACFILEVAALQFQHRKLLSTHLGSIRFYGKSFVKVIPCTKVMYQIYEIIIPTYF